MVIWITGKANSGKSTYAKRLKNQFKKLNGIVLLLDSDTIREQFKNNSYDNQSREEHIMNVANYAAIAEKQGFIVIVAIISPKKEWRMKARSKFEKSMLVYMPDGDLWDGTTYEVPDKEEMMLQGC